MYISTGSTERPTPREAGMARYDVWNATTRERTHIGITEQEAIEVTQCDDIAGWVEEDGRCDVDEFVVVAAGSPQPEDLRN